jgi:CheY-like chemotaxis protein
MATVTAERRSLPATPGVTILHRHTGDELLRVEAPTLRGAGLAGAALYGADLQGADLRGADLTGASLLGATLAGARLDAAKLHRATLYGADLTHASLRATDLRRTDLRAAILTGADLTDALVVGARHNSETRWPDGFDAHAYGAVAVRRRAAPRRFAAEAAAASHGDVLIVEDDDAIRATLSAVLRKRGFRSAAAGTGREALEYLRSGARPAVILLDLVMPEMDGWSFRIEQLRDPRIAQIPIVVCSACYDPLPAAKLARAHGYLVKPYDFDVVESTLRRFCEPDPRASL